MWRNQFNGNWVSSSRLWLMRVGVLWTSAEVFCISFKVGHASATWGSAINSLSARGAGECLSNCNFLNLHLACGFEFHESNGKPHFLVCTQSCFIFSAAGAKRREQEEESLNAMLMYSERGKRKHLRFSSVITQMKFMDAGNRCCGGEKWDPNENWFEWLRLSLIGSVYDLRRRFSSSRRHLISSMLPEVSV